MFQTDAGKGCSVEVVENGHLPTRILIDEEQDFAMFLVVVSRHERWTTSGEFYLRFLRRVPIVWNQPRFVCEAGWVAGSESMISDAGGYSAEKPGSSTPNILSADDDPKAQKSGSLTLDILSDDDDSRASKFPDRVEEWMAKIPAPHRRV